MWVDINKYVLYKTVVVIFFELKDNIKNMKIITYNLRGRYS